MYEVTIKKSFSAAHRLTEIGGRCENLHGHNFTVEVSISSPSLNSEGVVLDFRILKEWTAEVLQELDHSYLNEIPFFRERSPSSEHIAKFIYDRIHEKASQHNHNLSVTQVTIWEGEDSRATFKGETT